MTHFIRSAPEAAMTRWLLNEQSLPQGFDVEDECELRSSAELTSVIRCKHVDVESSEIRAHVSAGKRVFRLAMNWQENLSFVLHDDLSIRRIRINTFACIDPKNGWLIVNASSAKKSEELIMLLRKTLGTLNVVLLHAPGFRWIPHPHVCIESHWSILRMSVVHIHLQHQNPVADSVHPTTIGSWPLPVKYQSVATPHSTCPEFFAAT